MASSGVKDTDKGMRAMWKRALATDDMTVTVGVQGAKGQEHNGASEITNARLAGVHEFGAVIKTKRGEIEIPERSFIRSTVQENRDYVETTRRLSRRLIEGAIPSIRAALEILGMKISSDVKRAIEKGIEPANAASTIKAKGSSKPLIDTGQLKNSITYEVHETDERGDDEL